MKKSKIKYDEMIKNKTLWEALKENKEDEDVQGTNISND